MLSANQVPGLKTLIVSLKPFTRYQFRIRAATGEMDVKWGNFSASAEAITGEAGWCLLIYVLIQRTFAFNTFLFLFSILINH